MIYIIQMVYPNGLFNTAALMLDYNKVIKHNSSRQKLKRHLHDNRQIGI